MPPGVTRKNGWSLFAVGVCAHPISDFNAPGQSHCPKILRIYASRRQLIKQVHGKINRENDAAYQLTTRVSHKFVVTDANILYN